MDNFEGKLLDDIRMRMERELVFHEEVMNKNKLEGKQLILDYEIKWHSYLRSGTLV